MADRISVRTGGTRTRDPRAAAGELFAALDQPGIRFAVFYCSPDHDLPALAQALYQHFGDVNLIGCTTAGEITPGGYVEGALTGFSIASPDLDVYTQLIGLEPFDSAEVTRNAEAMSRRVSARRGTPASPTDTFAFLLTDGLAMQEEFLVSSIHQALHGIELVGGSAADGTRFQATQLYYRGRFHERIALLTLVRGDFPFVAFRTQHFEKSDARMVVTRADPVRRIVYEINGLPAGPEFARQIGLPLAGLTPLVFATHPVVVRVGGQYYVRSIARANPDGSLTFFCAIDTGIVLTIARGIDLVQNLEDAFAKVRAKIGTPQLVLGCDCILRHLEIQREGLEEPVSRIFSDNNVIGFATYGEQFNAMHVNQTFTGIAIGAGA